MEPILSTELFQDSIEAYEEFLCAVVSTFLVDTSVSVADSGEDVYLSRCAHVVLLYDTGVCMVGR